MHKESIDVNNDREDVVFPSKREAWLVGVLWLVILISVAGAIFALTLSLSIVSLFVQEVMWLGMGAFTLSILRSTNYTIKADSLIVRSGPFKWTIQFDDIDEVVPSRKAWASAALSTDRLFVDHKGPAGGTYISPENKQLFLETLAYRASSLRLEEDSVVRVNAQKAENAI
ncbi:MAG TPA: PH domain-containing protein [candidate division Zixibacteria bacterium]|nr:PH domain-containing protein [candidate division Zixibacteria bacterium]